MAQLELSVMAQTPEVIQELDKLLQTFKAQTNIQVTITTLPWATAWPAISRYAAYGRGPDVSEVGTTWMGDLASRGALAAFSAEDMTRLSSTTNYYRQTWQTCSLLGDDRVYAVPWVVGSRVLYYRRDLIEKAGVNPRLAFMSAQGLHNALTQLLNSGVVVPWAVPNRRSLNTVHFVASWIWGAGGDFYARDGKTLTLTQRETLDGLAEYFNLRPFFGAVTPRLSDLMAGATFWGGQAAVTIDGHWVYNVQKRSGNPDIFDLVEVTQVPGASFFGGSNLVTWKHARDPKAALELVHFLTSPEVEMAYYRLTGLLPARRDIFKTLDSKVDRALPIFEKTLSSGRALPVVPKWGALEEKLTDVFGQIWEEWLNAPKGSDIRSILQTRLGALEKLFVG